MKMEKHEHGTFSWVELGTTNAAAAKTFYSGLFGWTIEDMPAGPDMTYSMLFLDGAAVGGMYTMGKDMQGVPPNWLSYITVDDVDAVAQKVTANGGQLMKQPFDVMDIGRMAVACDPTGAAFALWQAKKHVGAGVLKEDGAMTFNELYTTNVDRAGKFYVSTLGWTTKAVDMGPMGIYTLFNSPNADASKGNIGGMMAMPPMMKNVPSNWLCYFQVSDIDASTKKVETLGGKVVMPVMDIPNIGKFSIVRDPQGATFALYKHMH